MRSRVEKRFEGALFASRWLAAPIYAGLVFCLVMLLVVFARYLVFVAGQLMTLSLHDAVLATIAFIDLALVANLVLIVIFAGYENFVSRMEVDDHVDRPAWMGMVGFTDLKLKLFASLVAITGIELLKAFLEVADSGHADAEKVRWLLAIHFTFLLTTVLSAASEWIASRAKKGEAPHS